MQLREDYEVNERGSGAEKMKRNRDDRCQLAIDVRAMSALG